jgi:DNA repair exonuclease SbcCD ATPase subunit
MKISQFFIEKPNKKVKIDDVRKKLEILDDDETKGAKFKPFFLKYLGINIETKPSNSSTWILNYDRIPDMTNQRETQSVISETMDSASQINANSMYATSPRRPRVFQPAVSVIESRIPEYQQQTINIPEIIEMTIHAQAQQTETTQQIEQKEQHQQLKNELALLTENLIVEKCDTANIKKEISRLKQEHTQLKQEHTQYIETIKKEHSDNIDTIKREHTEHIETLKREQEQHIGTIKREQEQHIGTIKREHKDYIDKKNQELNTIRSELNQEKQEYRAYKNMTVSQTIVRKLTDSGRVDISIAPRPKIYVEVRNGRNRFTENL